MKTRIASLLANRRPLAAAGRASARASKGTGAPSARLAASLSALVAALLLIAVAPVASAAECPNEAIREAQGTTYLPDCMALEMVSPPVKGNLKAFGPSISADGERVLFESPAALGETPGLLNAARERYVASRGNEGWDTAATTPPGEFHFGWAKEIGLGGPLAFTPDLGRWLSVQATIAEAQEGEATVYEGRLDGTWTRRSPLLVPADGHHNSNNTEGAASGVSNFHALSADLSHVFFRPGDPSSPTLSYLPGDPQPNSVPPLSSGAGGPGNSLATWNTYAIKDAAEGEPTVALLSRDLTGKAWGGDCGAWVGGGERSVAGTIGFGNAGGRNQGAVSPDGSRVLFSTRPDQPQPLPWELRKPACNTVGTANTTAGSNELTAVVSAKGTGSLSAGSAEVTGVTTASGVFLAGQAVTGPGVPPGTTITAVGPGTLELSAGATASGSSVALSAGAQPFAVGQAIEGAGIPAGTTITAVSGQTITLSAPATATATGVTVSAVNPIRIMERNETPSGIEISELLPATPAAGSDFFEGASVDGSRVYFTTTRQLAGGDGDEGGTCNGDVSVSQQGCDLYLYESTPTGPEIVQVSAGEATAGHPTPGVGAQVFRGVTAISGDGSHVYYVARGALTSAPNPDGAVPAAGDLNFYLYERDAAHPNGRTAFVGALDSSCTPVSNPFEGGPDCSELVGAVQSYASIAVPVPYRGSDGAGNEIGGDGHVLVFQSTAPLTADDQDGKHLDVFRYDSSADPPTLECVSCAPGDDGDESAFHVAPHGSLIGYPATEFAEQGRWVSEDGRSIVFATQEPLVPADNDGQTNPYLWQMVGGQGQLVQLPGAGVPVVGSTGRLPTPTVSASGEEVAFESSEQLLPWDGDTAQDIYLARVDGGFPNPASQTFCEGEACQGPPAPGLDTQIAASSAFSGRGNVKQPKPCGKGQVRKKGKCVKRKHHHNKHKRGRWAERAHRGAAR
ncbi:MAG: hypothetical protein JJE35_03760 [Thermoleophilia bacterium]|nr:hypothetical protein [Thermoleophilia bacterium]